jgi:preprotein translocase subunit SecD
LLAVVLVIVIMIVYYKFSGLLAVGALALYVLYTLAALAGFDAVLTMPGLAGFVLSIGIAVDANVLIFERIREEMARGKTIRTSIDEGFKHAMPAIIDSNVSTILTAAVLYQYGTGPVKGFAVTLIAGIAASLFTSIFVVRTFYLLWLQALARRPNAEHLRASHAAHSSRHQVRFHQVLEARCDRDHRVHRAGLRLHRLSQGAHSEAVNYSIEFTGGTLIQLKFAEPPGADVVRSSVDQAGFHGAEITEFGTPRDYTVKAQVVAGQGAANADSAGAQIKRALEARLGPKNPVSIQRTESVGARVGQELQSKALIAILISFAVTLVYLAFRFEWRFGVAAVAATAHDILTTLAFLSMMHLEVSADRRRRAPHGGRLLAQRHDHHLRPRPRESPQGAQGIAA